MLRKPLQFQPKRDLNVPVFMVGTYMALCCKGDVELCGYFFVLCGLLMPS